MTSFTTKKALLNPKFEGYRLKALDQASSVSRFPLTCKPTQATASGNTLLSFQEMQSRITHNHLYIEPEQGRAVYVDKEGKVCLIDFQLDERDDPIPSIRTVYQLPASISSFGVSASSHPILQREYPSAAFLSPACVAVSDGNGMLYILSISENSNSPGEDGTSMEEEDDGFSEPIGMFTLQTGSVPDVPFRIHHLHRASPTAVILLLSARYHPAENTSSKKSPVEFDLVAASIDLLCLRSSSSVSQAQPLNILWKRRGSEPPIYSSFVEEVNAWLVLSGSSYTDPSPAKRPQQKAYEPTSDEMAPIPRPGENLDPGSKSYPYSWTQSSDAVTVAFPLPAFTPKNDIKVLFTTQTLTLHVETNPGPPFPHYSLKSLWDSINPSSCFWTWDKEGEVRCGILTLHMEKHHEGTRWMQVFAARTETEQGEDEEVPETLDPSELWNMRESLEKYTASCQTGEDASGLGLGRGVPSLADGEMDEEVDAVIGRTAYIQWFRANGAKLPDKDEREDENEEIKILSMPMPSSTFPGADDQSSQFSLLLKNDLDGVVYHLSPSNVSAELESEDPTNLRWTHTLTYPALAFVLASKQDTRFVFHLPSISPSSPTPAVMAFESGTLTSNFSFNRGGNVYIYHPPSHPKENWAKQAVLKVDEGAGGALLGVVCLYVANSRRRTVVCLTEGDLVLIKDV